MCNTPTVAYRHPGINPVTGVHYKPFKFFQNWKDLSLFVLSDDDKIAAIKSQYDACPPGSEAVLLPCKHCLLCTRSYRRMWAFRLVSEARTSGESMFITLTVDDDNMQRVFPDGHLIHRPFQLFFKRLRKKLASGYKYQYVPPYTPATLLGKIPHTMEERFYQRTGIKYYMCGEYGDLYGRPHYHVCVFGARFPDAYFAKKVKGAAYYSSPTLTELWPYGRMSLFSDVNPETASYVAGYCDKKLDKHYWRLRMLLEDPMSDHDDAYPEYVRMSQGLGLDYYNQYRDSLYRFTFDGMYFGEFFSAGKVPISAPKYFDDKFRLQAPEKYDTIVAARERRRLKSLEVRPLDDILSESNRKHRVLVARAKPRETADYVV